MCCSIFSPLAEFFRKSKKTCPTATAAAAAKLTSNTGDEAIAATSDASDMLAATEA